MANYSISNTLAGTQQATSSAYKTLLGVTGAASAPRRNKIYDVMVGTLGTPADQSYEFDIARQTAVGTATAVTPNPLDPSDAAAVSVCLANATAEGTITAASDVWYIGMNQRASYRWVASPGSELLTPATSAAGLVCRARSVSGGTVTCTAAFLFQEQ